MFRRKLRHREAELYLSEPLVYLYRASSPFYNDDEAAKAALRETLNRARKLMPQTCHVYIGQSNLTLHDSNIQYLASLLSIKHCLQNAQWFDACSDMMDMLHYFHVEDGRVLNTIISLLEEYL